MKRNYRVPDAAEVYSLSRSRIYELIAAGEIESFKIGRTRLIAASALDAYCDRLSQSANSDASRTAEDDVSKSADEVPSE